MLVVHDTHQGHLVRSEPQELAAIGRAIKRTIQLVRDRVGNVSYNIVVHTLPHHHEDEFHWHVHVLPRVQSVGGFEQGTGVPINIVSPEQAAATLRGD
jgi:UDPglucose--hexose-1-phosphate uridylyltransferase